MDGNGVLDLGGLELELRLACGNFNLRLSSEVEFVTSRKDEGGAALDLRSVEHIFDGDGYHMPWVVKGHGYQLIVDLNTGAELEIVDEAFAQQVAAQLKHSETWNVLGLNVTSLEIRPTACQVTSWILSLEYDEQISLSEKQSLHKLSPDLSYSDTKPPPGIVVAKIEVVHVNMRLTPTLKAFARRPVPSDTFGHRPAGELETDMLLSANDTLDETWSSLLFDDPDDIKCNDLQMYFTAQQKINLASDIRTQEAETQTSEVLTTQQRCLYLTPPSSQGTLEPSQNEPALEFATSQVQRISTGDVLQVIEAGLKFATLKSLTRKVKSATVSSNEGFKFLSSIAPALWIPDYHRSVSSRAVMIPTISHAIANVSSHASVNFGLGEKVRQLACQQSHKRDYAIPSDMRIGANELQKTLSIRIWQGITSTLSSTASIRKLQPFSDVAGPNDHADAYGTVDDMLDGTATDQESCRSCDESDFEDIHDTLSEFEEEVEGEMNDLSELGSTRSSWSDELEDRPTDRWGSEDLLLSDFEPGMLEAS